MEAGLGEDCVAGVIRSFPPFSIQQCRFCYASGSISPFVFMWSVLFPRRLHMHLIQEAMRQQGNRGAVGGCTQSSTPTGTPTERLKGTKKLRNWRSTSRVPLLNSKKGAEGPGWPQLFLDSGPYADGVIFTSKACACPLSQCQFPVALLLYSVLQHVWPAHILDKGLQTEPVVMPSGEPAWWPCRRGQRKLCSYNLH